MIHTAADFRAAIARLTPQQHEELKRIIRRAATTPSHQSPVTSTRDA